MRLAERLSALRPSSCAQYGSLFVFCVFVVRFPHTFNAFYSDTGSSGAALCISITCSICHFTCCPVAGAAVPLWDWGDLSVA